MSELDELEKFIEKENKLDFNECDPLFVAGYKFAMDRVLTKMDKIKENNNGKTK